jgi:hypothetical protein
METVTQVLVVIGTLCAFISALADGPKAAAMVKGILGTKQSPTESPMLSVSMSKRKYWFLLVVSALAFNVFDHKPYRSFSEYQSPYG